MAIRKLERIEKMYDNFRSYLYARLTTLMEKTLDLDPEEFSFSEKFSNLRTEAINDIERESE